MKLLSQIKVRHFIMKKKIAEKNIKSRKEYEIGSYFLYLSLSDEKFNY